MLRRKRVLEGPRPVRAWVWAEQFIQDVRYALRTHRANPTFALVVILTLAVAIGMNTAIFSVFNAVVLRPLGYPNADRLVWLSTTTNDSEPGLVTAPDFADWRGQAGSFDRMVAYANADYTLVSPRGAARVRAAMVTEDFWDLSAPGPRPGGCRCLRRRALCSSPVVLLSGGSGRIPTSSAGRSRWTVGRSPSSASFRSTSDFSFPVRPGLGFALGTSTCTNP